MFPAKFSEALEAVIYIALHSGAGLVRGKDIAASKNLPPRHFEPILQALVKAKILKGAKGPKGGYSLAKERRKITIGELYRLFISQHDWDHSSSIATNIIDPVLKASAEYIATELDKTTVEVLCNKASNPQSTEQKTNFTI